MEHKNIEALLEKFHLDNPEIILSMVVTPDGLPVCYQGDSENFDLTGALYIQLKITCDQILSDLGCSCAQEIFVRSNEGCFVVFPIRDLGVLACMAKPEVNAQKVQILAWQTVIALEKFLG